MTRTAVRDELRLLDFFAGLTDTALHRLSQVVERVTLEPNEELFHEGGPREKLAVLVSGNVVVEKNLNGRPVRLVTLGRGEAVGEGILLDETPHGTGARALQR